MSEAPPHPAPRDIVMLTSDTFEHAFQTSNARRIRMKADVLPYGALVKTSPPLGPITPIPEEERETPSLMIGLVRSRRVVTDGEELEETRELCTGELFDEVAALGGILGNGSLLQG